MPKQHPDDDLRSHAAIEITKALIMQSGWPQTADCRDQLADAAVGIADALVERLARVTTHPLGVPNRCYCIECRANVTQDRDGACARCGGFQLSAPHVAAGAERIADEGEPD